MKILDTRSRPKGHEVVVDDDGTERTLWCHEDLGYPTEEWVKQQLSNIHAAEFMEDPDGEEMSSLISWAERSSNPEVQLHLKELRALRAQDDGSGRIW